jgi:hypothetical protein
MKINITVNMGMNTLMKLLSHKRSSGHILFLKQTTQILSGHTILERKKERKKERRKKKQNSL